MRYTLKRNLIEKVEVWQRRSTGPPRRDWFVLVGETKEMLLMDSGSRNLRRVIPAIVLMTFFGVACGSPSVFSQVQPQQVPTVKQAAPSAQGAPAAAVVNTTKPTFVEFYTTWCAPCKQMTPIIDKLRDEYGTRVDFKILDAAGATAEKQKYRYVTQPQMVIVNRKGEIVDTLYGVQGYNGLKKILDTVLAQPAD